jgi:hypothetical protein
MKKPILFAFFVLNVLSMLAADRPEAKPITGEIEVYFSPKGGCTDAVVKQISIAKSTIHVQAYSFTLVPIFWLP